MWESLSEFRCCLIIVVYKFRCTGCKSSYVGHTIKNLATRIKQHLNSDKNSHIYKHLKGSKTCEDKCSNNSFEIIDSAQTQYSLKLKEAIWIRWLKPALNIQKTNNVTLALNQGDTYYRPTRRATGGCNWRRSKISEKYTSYGNKGYQRGFYRSKT